MVLRFIPLFFIALMFVSCGSESGVQETNSPSTIVAVDGKKLFNIHCAACHKYNGTGGVSGAKDLTISTMSRDEIETLVLNGAGDMMPFKDVLKPVEIQGVVDHVQTLRN
jgi:mono/diheme cytochrome c family protein